MEQINDYAYPTMMAEAALKKLHQAMLERDVNAALGFGLEAFKHLNDVLRVLLEDKN